MTCFLCLNSSWRCQSQRRVVSLLIKARIVNKESEQYILNINFKSKKVRVNINQPIKAEGQTDVMRAVQDRKCVIQATIVCIVLDSPLPNQAIDALLEKEDIHQGGGDGLLVYVA
ncbi:hypothetical protein F5146DRAFT_1004554 [Armillaria mellea]|nr:hypothetical protein F5146DRAFT_1004554 [Armillaria mellea]